MKPGNNTGEPKLMLRVKELREAQGMTQWQLAERAGVSQPAVANWERGVFVPKTQDLPALARALKCRHIDDLYPEEVRP